MTIYTTTSKSRLHFAKDEIYLGSVSSYNNKLTRFLAALFKISIDLNINGKKRHLNKNQCIKLLKSHDKTIDLTDIKAIDLSTINIKSQGLIRDHISKEKVIKLTKKLINAIETGEYEYALRCLSKGADPNRPFWHWGEELNLTFSKDFSAKLPLENLSLLAYSHTPYTYAIKLNKRDIYNSMKIFQAAAYSGDVFDFKREIKFKTYTDTKEQTHTTAVEEIDSDNMMFLENEIAQVKKIFTSTRLQVIFPKLIVKNEPMENSIGRNNKA